MSFRALDQLEGDTEGTACSLAGDLAEGSPSSRRSWWIRSFSHPGDHCPRGPRDNRNSLKGVVEGARIDGAPVRRLGDDDVAMATPERVAQYERIVRSIAKWASDRDDVVAIALVGSWARCGHTWTPMSTLSS